MQCAWCLNEHPNLTRDHVVPRAIGGTLEYSVPACRDCQAALSKAERELSRKSQLAIHALSSQVRPRHPNRANSGLLKSPYLLVKHPLGGYCESVLAAGEKMFSLPYVEMKVVPGEPLEGRVRAATWEESEEMFSKYKEALARAPGPDGLVFELDASLSVPPSIADDPDFWPRMMLRPDGSLMVRARDPEEGKRFISVLTEFVLKRQPGSPDTWTKSSITAGTTHLMGLEYDPELVRRVAAKIAYGLALCFGDSGISEREGGLLRSYILGRQEQGDEPVTDGPEITHFTTGVEFHRFLLAPHFDPESAFISLYGHNYRVFLGVLARALPGPIVLLCATDGGGMREAAPAEAEAVLGDFQSVTWSSHEGPAQVG